MTDMKRLVETFVINLDRRPDRRLQIESKLKAAGIEDYNRVSAVDGRSQAFHQAIPVISNTQAACWLSHQKVMETFLTGSSEYALVLEDDADIDPERFDTKVLIKCIEAMREHSLSGLQVGWVEAAYPAFGGENLLSLVVGLKGRRIKKSTNGLKIYLNDFRAGTHAYIVNRNLASIISRANVPVAFAADDFLIAFAAVCHKAGDQIISRLTESLIGQQSRQTSSDSVDSDID